MPSWVSRCRSALLLVAAAASWGVGTVGSKRALDEIAPLVLLPLQLAVSVVFLAAARRWQPLVRRRAAAPGRGSLRGQRLGRLALLGVLNPGAAYALSLAGLVTITASLSVLLWAAEPVLILLLAWALLRERVTAVQVSCMVTATAGVLLVVAGGRSAGAAVGVLLTAAGVTACAVYTVASRRLIAQDSAGADAVEVVLVQQLAALGFAGALLAAAALTGAADVATGPVSITGWLAALASGVLYYGVAFWCYLAGLRRVPASTAGAFINLVPVFGVAAAALLLADRLTEREAAGGVLVVLAVTALATARGSGGRQASGPEAVVG